MNVQNESLFWVTLAPVSPQKVYDENERKKENDCRIKIFVVIGLYKVVSED